MKSALGWIVLAVIVIGGAGMGLSHYKTQGQQHAYEDRLAELKREFIQATVGLSLLDGDAYRSEIGIHLTKYFDRLNRLTKEFPEFYDAERQKAWGASEVSAGRMTQQHKMARDERIDIVLDLYNKMRDGQYRPLYTVADKAFRFDIHDIAPEEQSGNPALRVSYIHWGAFGPVAYNSIIGNIRAKQVAGKPVQIPQIVGEGQPPALQVKPEKWVNEFPPGMEVGYYYLPLLPQHAVGIQLSFGFTIKTVGGTDIMANMDFPDIAIADAWKVAEGKKWDAKARFADDEELKAAGKDAQAFK